MREEGEIREGEGESVIEAEGKGRGVKGRAECYQVPLLLMLFTLL